MKTIKFFLVRLAIISGTICLFSGCAKDDDGDGDSDKGKPVIISGTIDASASEAKSVLAIASDKSYILSQITNNTVSIKLENSQPWGLVFLNSEDQPLGLLSLGNGLETLPLHYLESTVDSVDLSNINFNGDVFIPSANPVGNLIPLTSEQVSILAGMDNYLTSLLLNPDVNGNGTIDLLEGRLFSLSVIYFIKPGKFHVPQLTPTLDNTTLIEGYRLFIEARVANYPETVYFTGPESSPLNHTPSESYMVFSKSRIYATEYLFDLFGNNTSFIPPGGTYTVNFGNEILTFNLPDQTNVDDNIVYPYPTIKLNNNLTLNKVDWTYRLPAGSINSDLNAIIDNIMVQIDGYGQKCEAIPNQNGLYGSGRLTVNTTSHILACQNIVWGNALPMPGDEYVERLMMTYADHYGTSYVVMYEKEYNNR